MADSVTQYLESYAQPQAACASHLEGTWRNAVVVPAYRESIDFLDGLRAALRGRSLLVVVVNRREGDHDAVQANDLLLEGLRASASIRALSDGVEQRRLDDIDLVLIDCSGGNRTMGENDGVGLARRIGLDFCLAAWRGGAIEGEWLHTTDADVTLPATYFDASAALGTDAVALTYPYRHVFCDASADGAQALALYELSMRYYLLGLRWARSPFAFSAIGSTIAVSARAYAVVRGVPRRQAGEDFYLLSKLAKHGAIVRPNTEPIGIRGVRTPRTPFGTAAAVAAIRAGAVPFRMYHPRCFELLKRWLGAVRELATSGDAIAAERLFDEPILGACLDQLGVRAGLKRACAQARSGRARAARIHAFFDAKRTLRLIHDLRDAGLGTLHWREAVAAAEFIPNRDEDSDDPFVWRAVLERLENDGPRQSGIDPVGG